MIKTLKRWLGLPWLKPFMVVDLFKANRCDYYTVRAITLLNAAGIHTVHELLGKSEYELLSIRGIGINTLGYIQDTLARHKLGLLKR